MNMTLCAGGRQILPLPHGHKPAIAQKRVVFPEPGSPTIKTRSPGMISTCGSFKLVHPEGEMTPKSSRRSLSSDVVTSSIRLASSPSLSISINAWRKPPTRKSVARQSAITPKLSTNHRSDCWYLIERANGHEQPTKRKIPGEVSGRCYDDRRDDREPSIAGRDPSQARRCADEPTQNEEKAIKLSMQPIARFCLAAVDGDRIAMLIDVNEGEAQIGLYGHNVRRSGRSAVGLRANSPKIPRPHREARTRPYNRG